MRPSYIYVVAHVDTNADNIVEVSDCLDNDVILRKRKDDCGEQI